MSTITRELAKLFRKITNSEIDAEGNAHVVLSPADSLLINNARIALASLEAEPVAWLLSGGGAKNDVRFDSSNAYADPLREVTPLYAAPQLPQPVVPNMAAVGEMPFLGTQENAFVSGWNACRAAMLQGKAEPAKTGLTLREGLAAIRISGIAIDAEKILAERDALNEPTCWCRTCRPVTVTDMRFVVCPQCGNKRCPHANDCRNACTGSNEPAQEGSAYPAAPQQEVKP
ncbi:MAG: hypothetical protein LKI85_09220 [Enterobacter sp.]|jgi:hypothetical protein|nr:hypothetical protein [Enterobacter sp.]